MFQYIQKYKIKSCLDKNIGENDKKNGKTKEIHKLFLSGRWNDLISQPTLSVSQKRLFFYIYKLLITRVVNKPISYQKGISKNKKSKNYRSNYYSKLFACYKTKILFLYPPPPSCQVFSFWLKFDSQSICCWIIIQALFLWLKLKKYNKSWQFYGF